MKTITSIVSKLNGFPQASKLTVLCSLLFNFIIIYVFTYFFTAGKIYVLFYKMQVKFRAFIERKINKIIFYKEEKKSWSKINMTNILMNFFFFFYYLYRIRRNFELFWAKYIFKYSIYCLFKAAFKVKRSSYLNFCSQAHKID